MGKAANALGNQVVEQRDLLHLRVEQLCTNGKRIESFKVRRGLDTLTSPPYQQLWRPGMPSSITDHQDGPVLKFEARWDAVFKVALSV